MWRTHGQACLQNKKTGHVQEPFKPWNQVKPLDFIRVRRDLSWKQLEECFESKELPYCLPRRFPECIFCGSILRAWHAIQQSLPDVFDVPASMRKWVADWLGFPSWLTNNYHLPGKTKNIEPPSNKVFELQTRLLQARQKQMIRAVKMYLVKQAQGYRLSLWEVRHVAAFLWNQINGIYLFIYIYMCIYYIV